MDPTIRRRLVLAHVAVAVVLVLIAVTAVVALRSTSRQLEEARQIDRRLASIDRLRTATRELALSARRYVLGGNLQEQQRALAIVHDMREERGRLRARLVLAKGPELEADLDEYVASLMTAMSVEDEDPVARLSRFEDELARIRAPLSMTFDEVISTDRARREELRSAQWLARGAQWAVVSACSLAVILLCGTLLAVTRQAESSNASAGLTRSRNELVAAESELRAPLASIIADAAQLRLMQREPSVARVLDNISRNASRVNAMLAELLDVTAIQTGATNLRRESLDAAALVDRAIREHRDEAHQRGIRLRYEAQLAVSVFADRERIKHVLDSLLQIAIAAARPGAELTIHVAGADEGIRFAIIEPGPGIEETLNQDLALHLCSRVIEAHGGRFGIQSSSISRTYWFTLPAEPSLLR